MAWIESHQELAHHPKVARLANMLDITVPAAIGHLHLFWWWCLAYADDGDVAEFDPFEVSYGAQWKGEPEVFVKALEECGWTDDGQVHDWHEYAGKLVERRRLDAERKRNARRTTSKGASDGHPADGSKDGVRTNQPTKPTNLTSDAAADTFNNRRALEVAKRRGARNPTGYAKVLAADPDFSADSRFRYSHKDCPECKFGYVETYSPGGGSGETKCEEPV